MLCCSRNILFQSLESDQMQIVVDAMFEKLYQPGDTIIKQGDDGDAFYVLHRGVAECFVQKVCLGHLSIKFCAAVNVWS